MKKFSLILGIVLMAVMSLSLAYAGDHGRSHDGDRKHGEHDVKIYGNIEKIPDVSIGTWLVKGKEVQVTKDTIIREKHGKAVAGAYVEISGNYNGKVLQAAEIEVKRAR